MVYERLPSDHRAGNAEGEPSVTNLNVPVLLNGYPGPALLEPGVIE